MIYRQRMQETLTVDINVIHRIDELPCQLVCLFIRRMISRNLSFSLLEFNFEHKRTRQTYTRHQTLELEKEFHFSK